MIESDAPGRAAGGRFLRGSGAPGIAFAVLLAACVIEAVLHPRLTSTDALNYVDVARHVARGDGLIQSTLGYNATRFPVDGSWPVPYTAQPPLYPLLAAALLALGLAPVPAGACVTLAALGAVWLLAYRISRESWGPGAATIAVMMLAIPVLKPDAALRVPTELPAIAFALLSVWLEDRGRRVTRSGALLLLAAGASAGLAFATRYLFVVALPVGLLYAARRERGWRSLSDAAAFALGWLVTAGPVLWRNVVLTGSVLGGERNPSEVGLTASLGQVTAALVKSPARVTLVAILALGVLLALLAAPSRARLRDLFGRGCSILLVWAAAYVVALVALRSRVQFDVIGLRLLAPAAAMLAPGLAALLASALPRRLASWLPACGVIVAVALVALVGARTARTRFDSMEARIARSPRLSWIRDHTGARDLIVGHLPVEIPLLFAGPDGGPRPAASIARMPYMAPVTAAELVTFARNQRTRFANVYLVLRLDGAGSWQDFGPFIAGLVAGRRYDGVIPVTTLPDARAYRLDPDTRLPAGSR